MAAISEITTGYDIQAARSQPSRPALSSTSDDSGKESSALLTTLRSIGNNPRSVATAIGAVGTSIQVSEQPGTNGAPLLVGSVTEDTGVTIQFVALGNPSDGSGESPATKQAKADAAKADPAAAPVRNLSHPRSSGNPVGLISLISLLQFPVSTYVIAT